MENPIKGENLKPTSFGSKIETLWDSQLGDSYTTTCELVQDISRDLNSVAFYLQLTKYILCGKVELVTYKGKSNEAAVRRTGPWPSDDGIQEAMTPWPKSNLEANLNSMGENVNYLSKHSVLIQKKKKTMALAGRLNRRSSGSDAEAITTT